MSRISRRLAMLPSAEPRTPSLLLQSAVSTIATRVFIPEDLTIPSATIAVYDSIIAQHQSHQAPWWCKSAPSVGKPRTARYPAQRVDHVNVGPFVSTQPLHCEWCRVAR